MTDDRTVRALPRVAELIAKADALLITAGAGMSVDSGLPDFRGAQGFWRAYPPLEKLGISFEEMAQPHWFEERPEMAWAFYGHRQQLYRATKPHMGYWMLRDWARVMPAGYFVVTSNVDGAFEAAGFDGEGILEQHGNIHRLQCTEPCGAQTWSDEGADLKIDLAVLEAKGTLPRCPECGALARPNVLMFGDTGWVPNVTREQERRYRQWLASVRGKRLVIVELGAGKAIATIRVLGEKLAAERDRTTLVRINPEASAADEPARPIRMGALEALRRIEETLPEGFKSAVSAVPELPKPRVCDEADDVSHGTPQRDLSQINESIKWSKVYARPWRITLPSGSEAWVEQVDVCRTYLGMLTGIPPASLTQQGIDDARQFVRKHFYGPEAVVIRTVLFDADSNEPILPPLRFAARIRSWERINDEDEGSWMNLVWFAEIDDDKPVKAFVEEALRQVDWKRQAEGYSI